MRPADTTADAHAAQLAVYRRMTPAQRVAVAAAMSDDVRAIAIAGIAARHPAYTAADAEAAYLRLTLGESLFTAAFPHRPRLAP
ncbi:MAG: hypothetical protein R2939_08320 [Kofleriaceae bacterium]